MSGGGARAASSDQRSLEDLGWELRAERDGLRILERGPALCLQLARPHALNAVDFALAVALREELERAGKDAAVRAVLLCGEGRAFCAGADISGALPEGDPRPRVRREMHQAYNPITVLLRLIPKPVLAAVRGAAAGIGCSFAIACDQVLAGRSSYLLLAFANIGLTGDGGATLLVPARAGLGRAASLTMLAERLPAEQALDWGLVDHLVEDDDVIAAASELVTRLAAGPTRAHAATKSLFNAAMMPTLVEHLALETEAQAELIASSDYAEGIAAFAQRRLPAFRGFGH
ncbi:MAG: enoyl-CoA hydratase/isomerase family protein [Solirubrobacteraceae bacterium]